MELNAMPGVSMYSALHGWPPCDTHFAADSHMSEMSTALLSPPTSSSYAPASGSLQDSPLMDDMSTLSESYASEPPAATASSTEDSAASRSAKRRANTLAARRYRQNRLDRLASLEAALAVAQAERDALKVSLAKAQGENSVLRTMLAHKLPPTTPSSSSAPFPPR